MKTRYRPFVVVFVVFAAVMAVVGVSRWRQREEIVPWRNDFAAARAEAATSGKPVFAYFTAEWCGPCFTMKSTTWADRDVEAALRAYVPVRIDIDRNTPVALEYDAQTIPKFAVLDGEGKVVKSMEGYMEPEEFLAWLKG
jgi:thiol:disulfide interchange protein